MAKGLQQSAAARVESGDGKMQYSALLVMDVQLVLTRQCMALLGTNYNKRGVANKEEEIRKAN
jgi:hypothetical protein